MLTSGASCVPPESGYIPDRNSDLSIKQRDLIRTARQKIDDGDCAMAWGLLWTAFRDGDALFATTLAELIVYEGLVPPGSSPDRLSQERHASILAMHGVAGSTAYSRHIVYTLFEGPGEPGSFTRCMNENFAQPSVCVDEAIYYRLLPARSVYIAETEALARAVEQPAVCAQQAVLLPAVP